jgi:hypothetical protein
MNDDDQDNEDNDDDYEADGGVLHPTPLPPVAQANSIYTIYVQ